MTLVVAPASIFDPAVPVIGDVIYGDSDKAISGAALAQTFLFVSGNAEGALLDALPAGAVLAKPFTQEALAARLLELLGRAVRG